MAQKQELNQENKQSQEITDEGFPKLNLDELMKRLGGVEYEQYLARKRKEGVVDNTQNKEQYNEILSVCRDMMKKDKLFQQCLKQHEQKKRGRQEKTLSPKHVIETNRNNKENEFIMESCLQQEKLSVQPIKINQNLRKNLFGTGKKTAHPKLHTSNMTKVNVMKPPKVSILAKPLEMTGAKKKNYEKPKNTAELTNENHFDQFKVEIQKILQQQFDDFKKEIQNTLKHQFDELRNEQLRIQKQLEEFKNNLSQTETQLEHSGEILTEKENNTNQKQVTPLNVFIHSPQNSSEEFEKFEKCLGIRTGKENKPKVTFHITPVKYKSESDLRKTALLKSGNKSQAAIDVYNSCRNVCWMLQTPKHVDYSSDDDNSKLVFEQKLSKTVLMQCEMLLNTPRNLK